MPDGPLGVAGSKAIIPGINKIAPDYDFVCMTRDWHPKDHCSFASAAGCVPYSVVNGEMKWPDHCVANTHGAALVDGLITVDAARIYDKGTNQTPGYSIAENKQFVQDLSKFKQVDFVGVALDYCVKQSAIGFKNASRDTKVRVILKLTRSVDAANNA